MQELIRFSASLYQYIESIVFLEVSKGGYSPLNPPMIPVYSLHTRIPIAIAINTQLCHCQNLQNHIDLIRVLFTYHFYHSGFQDNIINKTCQLPTVDLKFHSSFKL